MKIGGYDIPLRFSTKAMIDIEELIHGDVEKLSEYIGAEDITTGTKLKRLAEIIAILANGHVFTFNQDLENGLVQGEPKKFYSVDFFLSHLDLNNMNQCMGDISKEIYNATDVVVPDNVKLAEEDEVLAEIEEIKNQ